MQIHVHFEWIEQRLLVARGKIQYISFLLYVVFMWKSKLSIF